ncbi:hypothetical protein D3C81_1102320 [compost metagenome]
MGFVPIHLRLEINPFVVMIQDHILRDFGLAETPVEAQHVLDWTACDQTALQQYSLTGRLLFITRVNVPSIPQGRTVVIEVEAVRAFARFHDFPAGFLIPQANDLAAVIKFQAVEFRFPLALETLDSGR